DKPVMKIQRLAWAGIKIEVGTTTLFVDATAYEEQKDKKLETSTEFTHALITHHHSDHFDPAALKSVFDKRSRLFCFEDSWPWIDARDLRMQTAKLHQPVDISRRTSDLVAIPVPAVDGFGHPQVSWVIRGGGKKIIHCGDTLWHGYWRDIANAYGPFDIAFMPINAARLNQGEVVDTGIPAVLNPEQAVVASKLLQAKIVCPIHYGRTSENYFETPDPEENFIKYAKERNVRTMVLQQYEFLKWPSDK
ncbi:MAG: MBL fold metallo-hydrolase, partial [Bacteroidota bacterium]